MAISIDWYSHARDYETFENPYGLVPLCVDWFVSDVERLLQRNDKLAETVREAGLSPRDYAIGLLAATQALYADRNSRIRRRA